MSIILKNSIRNSGLNQSLGNLSLFSFSEFEQIHISRYKIKVPYNALDAHEIPNPLEKGRKRNSPKKVSTEWICLCITKVSFWCKSKARVWRTLFDILAFILLDFLKIAFRFFTFAYCLFLTPTFFFFLSLAKTFWLKSSTV